MHRQQISTKASGKPHAHYNRSRRRNRRGGKNRYNVSGRTTRQIHPGSYRHPEIGYATRNGVIYPRGRDGQVYVSPPMRGNDRSKTGPPPGFSHRDRKRSNRHPPNKHPTVSVSSSSQDVRTSPVHSSRSPKCGKPISPASGNRRPGGTFAKGPDPVGNGFKLNRSGTNRRRSYTDSDLTSTMSSADSSKSVTPIFHLEMDGGEVMDDEDAKFLGLEAQMGKVSLDEKKVTSPVPTPVPATRPRSETISEGLLPSPLRETLERLLATFKMTGHWTDGQYKSPSQWSDVSVDPKGNMRFLITNRERYDIGIPLLLGTLSRIHQMCMIMRMWAKRASSTDKPNSIVSRCLEVDPFEVSWAIQIHLFKMHRNGVRCVVMGMNNTLCIDKSILLQLVRDSLTRTYMSKENALWAFNTIATAIINEW